MEKTTLKVEGMSCSHCETAVINAIGALEGVSGAKVDLQEKTVTVEYDPDKLTLENIKNEIDDLGYDVI